MNARCAHTATKPRVVSRGRADRRPKRPDDELTMDKTHAGLRAVRRAPRYTYAPSLRGPAAAARRTRARGLARRAASFRRDGASGGARDAWAARSARSRALRRWRPLAKGRRLTRGAPPTTSRMSKSAAAWCRAAALSAARRSGQRAARRARRAIGR
eukprot:1187266-Prymnesium_polylepis.1